MTDSSGRRAGLESSTLRRCRSAFNVADVGGEGEVGLRAVLCLEGREEEGSSLGTIQRGCRMCRGKSDEEVERQSLVCKAGEGPSAQHEGHWSAPAVAHRSRPAPVPLPEQSLTPKRPSPALAALSPPPKAPN